MIHLPSFDIDSEPCPVTFLPVLSRLSEHVPIGQESLVRSFQSFVVLLNILSKKRQTRYCFMKQDKNLYGGLYVRSVLERHGIGGVQRRLCQEIITSRQWNEFFSVSGGMQPISDIFYLFRGIQQPRFTAFDEGSFEQEIKSVKKIRCDGIPIVSEIPGFSFGELRG